MPPELNQDQNTDDPEAGKGKDVVEGLKSALEAERDKRQAAEREAAEFRGRASGLETAGARPEPAEAKDLTRADLRKAVEDEKITQDEADALLDQQFEARILKKATEIAGETVDSSTLNSRITTEIDRYKKAVDGLGDKESQAFKKVQAEFDHLTDLGYDNGDLRTEAAALRTAFGPIEALETAGKPRDRDGHQETGGRDDSGDGGSAGEAGYPRNFPANMRAHYDKMIENGQYKGRDDPTLKKEIARWQVKNPQGQRRGRAA